MTNKILALVDGSAHSRSVCLHAAWIAQRLGPSVELLHVLGRREGGAGGDLSGALQLGARTALLEQLAELDAQRAKLAQAKGRAILDDAQAILAEGAVTEVTPRLRQGDLIEAVSELEPTLRALVIGRRGEAAGFAAGHLGSNLERIIRSSKVPVFVATADYRPISRVLVAYDGGDSARTAIRRMAESAVFEGLEITLACSGSGGGDCQRKLDEAQAVLAAGGLQASTAIVSGEPDVALQKKIEAESFDLLV
ncbi:universal stress protein UspA, partial [Cereibacter changlensis JA139]